MRIDKAGLGSSSTLLNEELGKNPILNTPPEISTYIFSFLDQTSLSNVALVSKRTYEVVQNFPSHGYAAMLGKALSGFVDAFALSLQKGCSLEGDNSSKEQIALATDELCTTFQKVFKEAIPQKEQNADTYKRSIRYVDKYIWEKSSKEGIDSAYRHTLSEHFGNGIYQKEVEQFTHLPSFTLTKDSLKRRITQLHEKFPNRRLEDVCYDVAKALRSRPSFQMELEENVSYFTSETIHQETKQAVEALRCVLEDRALSLQRDINHIQQKLDGYDTSGQAVMDATTGEIIPGKVRVLIDDKEEIVEGAALSADQVVVFGMQDILRTQLEHFEQTYGVSFHSASKSRPILGADKETAAIRALEQAVQRLLKDENSLLAYLTQSVQPKLNEVTGGSYQAKQEACLQEEANLWLSISQAEDVEQMGEELRKIVVLR